MMQTRDLLCFATGGLLLAVLLVTGSAAGQQEVRNETLIGAGPLSFEPIDTFVQEASPAPQDPHEATGVRLRSEQTGFDSQNPNDEGQRIYLLSLSSSGGGGIPQPVRDRYIHGIPENATLTLRYNGGCNGALGTFTVRAIGSPNWDPRNVLWNDTDLSQTENPPVQVLGPVLAKGQAGMAAGNCTRIELTLGDGIADVLEGKLGGLAVFWDAPYPVTLFTTSNAGPNGAGAGPRLWIEFTTNAPIVREVDIGETPPRLRSPESPLRVKIVVERDEAVAPGGVVVRVKNQTSNQEAARITTSKFADGTWRADFQAPDEEGTYSIEAEAIDRHGWLSSLPVREDGPALVLDASAPLLNRTRLNNTEPGIDITLDQGTTAPLDLRLVDTACAAGVEPCIEWAITWGPPGTAPWRTWNGSTDPDPDGNATVQVELPMDRPGSWRARLSVLDPLGQENQTAWNLTIRDTRPPEARPLHDSMLGPGTEVTVQGRERVRVTAEILDDPPVEAVLVLEPFPGRGEVIRHTLITTTNATPLRETVPVPPPGSYRAFLELDDGTHPIEPLPWGLLRVIPGQAPGIHIEPAHRRLGPETTIRAELRDGNIDLNRTRVEAFIEGSRVTPHVELEPTDGGGAATITLGGLSHGETVRVVVNATDDTNHRSQIEATFQVDLKAPQLLAPTSGAWLTPSSVVDVQAEDPGGGVVIMRIHHPRGTREVGSLDPLQRILQFPADKLLPTGRTDVYKLTFELRDEVGNRVEVDRWLGVDVDPPVIEADVDATGVRLNITDRGSNVSAVEVLASKGIDYLRTHLTAQESQGIYRVLRLDDLQRGDRIRLAVEAADEAGNIGHFGTPSDPLQIVVPDRPPTVELERRTPGVGSEGIVAWSVEDPDTDPITVTVRVIDPTGKTTVLEEQNSTGEHTIRLGEPGRYRVRVEAESFGALDAAETSVYLGPGGRVTSHGSTPERVPSGEPLEVRLNPPEAPEEIFVWAEDETGIKRPASSVTWEEDVAIGRFDALPDGDYHLWASILHEPGAVEELDLGTVHVGGSPLDRLAEAAPALLAGLALVGLVALGLVFVLRSRDDNEAT